MHKWDRAHQIAADEAAQQATMHMHAAVGPLRAAVQSEHQRAAAYDVDPSRPRAPPSIALAREMLLAIRQ
jgi:hypothetical protein